MAKKNGGEEATEMNTCPKDPRHHNQNMTIWCMYSYLDYKKCIRLLGEQHEPCQYFYRCYRSLCPNAWVERWEQQIVDGTFPYDLPEEKEPDKDKKGKK